MRLYYARFHYTTDSQFRDYEQKRSPDRQPAGIRDQIPTYSSPTNKLARTHHLRQNVRYNTVSLKNSNCSVETQKITLLHYYASTFSLTTKTKRLPETSPNPFRYHGVYPVKPAGNKRRQPIAVTHPNLCATITSWQNKNTIQSQNSLPQSPKAIETSPQSFTEMAQQ
jgi:hypothetical protein